MKRLLLAAIMAVLGAAGPTAALVGGAVDAVDLGVVDAEGVLAHGAPLFEVARPRYVDPQSGVQYRIRPN